MGAALSIVVGLSSGAADGGAGAGALAAGADWLAEGGVDVGVCEAPDDCATVNIGANMKPAAAASIATPVFLAESSRISHLNQSGTGPERTSPC